MSIEQYKSALVTGASSGIGAAIVRRLSERGVSVHALGRRADRLADLAVETGCTTQILDLLDTDSIYRSLSGLKVDILVNNAGLGLGMDGLPGAERSDIDITIDTNVKAVMHIIRAVVPGMIERRHGHIVNISSVAGLYPIKSAIYGASKGAVHLLSQNLRIELQGTKIRVTEICPGRVDTEFFATAFGPGEKAVQAGKSFRTLTADDIAEAVVFAVDRPHSVNISTIEISPTEQAMGGISIVKTD